jgi:hypothetical protein
LVPLQSPRGLTDASLSPLWMRNCDVGMTRPWRTAPRRWRETPRCSRPTPGKAACLLDPHVHVKAIG